MSATLQAHLPTSAKPTEKPPRPTNRWRRRERTGWLFVAPFVVVFVIFLIVPLIYAFQLSLFNKTLTTGTTFVGLSNYIRAFQDPLFLEGIAVVAKYAIVVIPAQMILAIIIALVLDTMSNRLSKFSRLLIFTPYAIPVVIGALMWGFLYSRDFGPLTGVINAFGMDAPNFLGSTWVIPSLSNVVVWQWTGYNMIIVYSALRGIDPTLYEAARMDGANAVQIALRIKLPMISPALILMLVFSLIGTLQLYTEPKVLSSASMSSITNSFTPNMYAQSLAFGQAQVNYASAVSFALGLVVFIGSFIFLSSTRKQNGLS